MTDSLADWAQQYPKPLKRWLIKIVPIDVHSKINSQPFIQSERGFTNFSLKLYLSKVLENLTVSKLNIFSSFIQPLSFLSDLFYSLS
jgi:hypothetical protein